MAQAIPLLILLSFLFTQWKERRSARPSERDSSPAQIKALEKTGSAGAFYTLAARYILARHPEARSDDGSLPSGIRNTLARYETIRFQPSHSDAPLDSREKHAVMAALRDL
jgi:hypothetical protein